MNTCGSKNQCVENDGTLHRKPLYFLEHERDMVSFRVDDINASTDISH